MLKAKWSRSVVSHSATPWTVAHQASPSMGFFQARVLEWVAISFSRRSSRPRDWTRVSLIVGRRFTVWATREASGEALHCNILKILIKLTYLFLAVPGLCCRTWAFSSCGGAQALGVGGSVVAAHRLVSDHTWNLPRPGLEPVPPALQATIPMLNFFILT